MQLERVKPEHAYTAAVKWMRPVPYDKILAGGSSHDAEGWLYMILGYLRSSHPKIFYVGKVVSGCASRRLKAPDHRKRYRRLCREHRRHSFLVSLGAVKIPGGHVNRFRI